jgi:PAS domain S-box-containing protein
MGAAAQLIGEGDYAVQMPHTNLLEVQQLLDSFGFMKEKIAARDREILETNLRLQSSLDYADLIIESMPEAIIIAEKNGKIIRANGQVVAVFGYEPQELLGQPIEILVPQNFQSAHPIYRTNYLAEQVSRPMGAGKDLYGRRKDGSEVPVEVGLNIVHSDNGINILATVIDISNRKKNEAKLLHSNTRYKLAASAAGLGFWDYDLTSGMLSWDENMYHIYGYEQASVSEQPYTLWSNAVHPEDLYSSEQALQMAIRGEAPFDTEFRIIHPGGEIHFIKAQAFVLRNDKGAAVKIYGVNLDITARKKAEKQQQKLVRDLSLINAELNSFTYVASHDLKSPLRGVDQLAGWIMEDLADNLSPVTRKHLELMQNRIHRMEKLLDDLLEYSRAGRNNTENVQVDTELMVRDILDFIGPFKQINLIFHSSMPVFVTKKVPLDAVFRNLISNAIKHHPANNVDIYISCRQLGEFYEFGVGDNGAGIAPEHQSKIFLMFQTLKSRDLVEGSGIGLALVKKLVEGLDGTIRVESDGRSGTWFYFTWPIAPNDVY